MVIRGVPLRQGCEPEKIDTIVGVFLIRFPARIKQLNKQKCQHMIDQHDHHPHTYDTEDCHGLDQAYLAVKGVGNKKPADLLSSRYGAQMVLIELGRIEHGVIS